MSDDDDDAIRAIYKQLLGRPAVAPADVAEPPLVPNVDVRDARDFGRRQARFDVAAGQLRDIGKLPYAYCIVGAVDLRGHHETIRVVVSATFLPPVPAWADLPLFKLSALIELAYDHALGVPGPVK